MQFSNLTDVAGQQPRTQGFFLRTEKERCLSWCVRVSFVFTIFTKTIIHLVNPPRAPLPPFHLSFGTTVIQRLEFLVDSHIIMKERSLSRWVEEYLHELMAEKYMILSTFVVTELQREWESGRKMLVFKVIITSESHSPKSDIGVNN